MCEHCKKKISDALLRAGIEASIDLSNKLVTVSDEEERLAKNIIIETGYIVE